MPVSKVLFSKGLSVSSKAITGTAEHSTSSSLAATATRTADRFISKLKVPRTKVTTPEEARTLISNLEKSNYAQPTQIPEGLLDKWLVGKSGHFQLNGDVVEFQKTTPMIGTGNKGSKMYKIIDSKTGKVKQRIICTNNRPTQAFDIDPNTGTELKRTTWTDGSNKPSRITTFDIESGDYITLNFTSSGKIIEVKNTLATTGRQVPICENPDIKLL